MNSVSKQEIKRQYRVLRQTLEMHSMLQTKYSHRSKISKIIILICSCIFCATTFASDQLFVNLNLPPDKSKIVLGVASVLAFAFALVLMVFNWEGKSAQHKDAFERWSSVLQKFREHRQNDKTWPEFALNGLSCDYWEADRNSAKIPNKCFNRLKSRYLLKVEISKLKSSYPACPRWVLYLFVLFRDSYRAIHKIVKSNPNNNRV